ncbi:cucumisin-like [Primulina huaijiensis]|uniref:cucumisin-like n=1 Tax=Primulina huaijiensis TaxID=1492673 RepID=UPI003CC761C1
MKPVEWGFCSVTQVLISDYSASSAKESLIYSYGRSFNGFAAKLTKDEAESISKMKEVISVIPNRILKLHSTRSWDFMGFSQGKLGAAQEGEVIVGLLDTGAWPEHPSFNDTGYGSPPAKWKGTCQTKNFTCNNKLIGARYYNSDNSYYETDIPSPRDSEGHGTHTSSTVAGVYLPETSFFGLAEGVARGGVPYSRIAVYKVCWANGCGTADILKAFDDAIADGVDIIAVSLGGGPEDYFEDPIAIGAFHAMKNGILVSNSAGNDGPDPVSISNYAPWTLTVAASTIDRRFVSNLALGNGEILTGISINTYDLNGTTYPLIWGGDAVNYTAGSSPDSARYCFEDAMNADMLAGKLVFCEAHQDGSTILLANGVGTIMSDELIINPTYAFSYQLPATLISPQDGRKVLDYIRSTHHPVATILVGETWKDAMAPLVVSFSSRGPNPTSPYILKPDITAPGVDILAGMIIGCVEETRFSRPDASKRHNSSQGIHCNRRASARDVALISVTIEPSVLTFSEIGETQSFTVKVTGPTISQQPIMSGAITWSDGTHAVRTPLVVYNYIPGAPYSLYSDESSVLEKKPKLKRSPAYPRTGNFRNHMSHQ